MSEGPNPFAPPKAEWERDALGISTGDDYVDATQGARFANLILDAVIRFGMMFGLLAALGDNAFVSIFVAFGYYIVFEAIFARTPAKWITKTRVIALDGSKPRFLQILGRSLSRYVPFEPFSFLGNARGWHDRWSGTRVVVDRPVGGGSPFPKD